MQQQCISGERQGGLRPCLGHRSDPALYDSVAYPAIPATEIVVNTNALGSLGTGDKLKIANRWVYHYYLDQVDQEPTGITGLFAPLGSSGRPFLFDLPAATLTTLRRRRRRRRSS